MSSSELMNLESNEIDFAGLQNIINKAMSRQNEQLYKEMKKLEDSQNKIKEEFEIKTMEFDSLRDMEIKRHRTAEYRYGFVSLGDLGQCYSTSIGSKTMGKLLRLVGLAKNKQSKTEPYRESIVNNYSKSQMYGDNVTYQWNPEKCIVKIDKWLTKVGVINEFYSIDDEDALKNFINQLETDYEE